MWRDAKYLIAYALPLTTSLGIYAGGPWVLLGVLFAFVLIPVVDYVAPQSKENLDDATEETQVKRPLFDYLLYFNLPLLYCICYLYFMRMGTYGLYEWIGATMSIGILVGSIGINVAHELGHRSNRNEQFIAKLLLLPALYMHFFIEHNRGHHKNVATDHDPASSRRGEVIYAFWFRSIIGGYYSAWQIQKELLVREDKKFWSIDNEMLIYHVVQVTYLANVYLLLGWQYLIGAIGIALVGVLLLESVNYIEHYGLRRKQLENGRFEPVLPHHSWNSDHELGRIVLYELTRHSDHHFRASRKYQILRHHDESPQLPLGYPGSILLSLIPPLWFSVMHNRLAQYSKS